MRVDTVSLQQFTSLFNSYDHAFRHDGNSVFVRTFYYNVTVKSLYRAPAAFALRDNEPAGRGAAGPLSCREVRHENSRNTNKKQNQNENESHTVDTSTYILVSYSPSAQRMLPRTNTIS